MASSKLNIDITAKDNASPAFNKAAQSADKMGQSVDKMGVAASGAAAIVSGVLTNAVKNMGKEMLNLYHTQERAEATLEATTGAMAGHWKEFAADIQATSIFGDEVIIQKALVPLDIFFKGNKKMIETLTQASADMASALGKDVGNVAQSLGRYVAMGSRGMSMLERQGVLFTDQLKEQVKELEEQGKLEEAKLMMANFVAETYRGQAEAIANTSFGSWEQFKNLLGDVKESFGKILADYLAPILKEAKKLLDWVQGWSDGTKSWAVKLGGLVVAGGALFSAVTAVKTIHMFMTQMAGINMFSASAASMGTLGKLTAMLGRVVPYLAAVKVGYDIGEGAVKSTDHGESAWKGAIQNVLDKAQIGNQWVLDQFGLGGGLRKGRDVAEAWAQGKTYEELVKERTQAAIEEHKRRMEAIWDSGIGSSSVDLGYNPPKDKTPKRIQEKDNRPDAPSLYLINNQMFLLISLQEMANYFLGLIANNTAGGQNVGGQQFNQAGAVAL